MKNYKREISVVLLFLISACSDLGNNSNPAESISHTGSISFRMAKSTIPAEVGILEVRLEKDGDDPITSTTFINNFVDTVRIAMNDIPVGTWQLSIDAKDSSGHLRYTGNTLVTILED